MATRSDALQLVVGHDGVKIGADALAELAKRAKQAEAGARPLRRETAALDAGFSKLARTARRMGGALAAAFAINKIREAADSWAQYSNRVGQATGSMETASLTMERLLEISRNSFTTMESSVRGFERAAVTFKDMGRSADEAADFVESLNLHLVAGYVEGERAATVQNALSKAMAVGKLNAQQLETVLGNSAEVSKALADELGIAVSGLREAASQGKITGDVIADALGGRLDEIREQVEKMPWTMGGAFTAVSREFQVLVARVNEGVGATSFLAQGMSEIAGAMAGVTASGVDRVLRAATDAAVLFIGAISGAAIVRATIAMRAYAASVQTTVVAYNAGVRAARLYHSAMSAVGGPIGLAVIGATALVARFALAAKRAEDLRREVRGLGVSLEYFHKMADEFYADRDNVALAENVQTVAEAESKRLRGLLADLYEEQRKIESVLPALQTSRTKFAKEQVADYEKLLEQIAETEQMLGEVELAGGAAAHSQERLKRETAETRKQMQDMSEDQYKVYTQLVGQTEEMGRRKALIEAEMRLGDNSLKLAIMRNEQEREVALHKLEQARAMAEGNVAFEQAVDLLEQATNATFDAQHQSLVWADNMSRVRAELAGIASILGQIGGGLISNADMASQIKLIREGVDPARARIQIQREAQLREIEAEAMGGGWGGRLIAGAKKAVTERGFELQDELARVTEEANKSASKASRGRSSAASAAAKQAKAIKDVVAGLKDEIAQVGLSEKARRLHQELQRAGVDLYSREGQQISDMVERLQELQDAQEKNAEASRQAGEWNRRFLDALANGRKGMADFLKQLAMMNLQLALLGKSGTGGILGSILSRITGGDPLTNALRGAGLPAFAGGGHTGYGPRTGGVDGQGGFMAILHPNESVIDHTKGRGGGGGGTMVQVINNTGQPVEEERGQGPNGEEMIRLVVGRQIGRGDYDGGMSRYGNRPTKVVR